MSRVDAIIALEIARQREERRTRVRGEKKAGAEGEGVVERRAHTLECNNVSCLVLDFKTRISNCDVAASQVEYRR